MQKRFLLGLASAALVGLSACEANLNASLNPSASPSPAASSSPDPSASPDPAASATPNASASASTSVNAGVSVGANTNTNTNTSASAAAKGVLTVSGANLFDQYEMSYSKGMKWVYGMKNEIGAIAVPNLPGGVSIPGLGGSGSGGSSMDLGTFSMEVIDVQGDMVTIRTEVNNTMAGAPAVPPTEKTVQMKSVSALYVEGMQAAGSGTLDWTSAGGSESVSVPAGTYNASVVLGKTKVVLDGAAGALDQDIKVWMVDNIGMVKEEVKGKTQSSGVSVDTTTVIELKSFTR